MVEVAVVPLLYSVVATILVGVIRSRSLSWSGGEIDE